MSDSPCLVSQKVAAAFFQVLPNAVRENERQRARFLLPLLSQTLVVLSNEVTMN